MWRLRMCHKCFLDSTNILQISPIYSWHWHIPLILSTRYPKYIFLSAVWHKSRNISGFKTIQKESRQYRWIQDNTSWVKRLAGYCHVLLTIWTDNRQTAPFGLHTYLAYKNVICIHKKIRCELNFAKKFETSINHISRWIWDLKSFETGPSQQVSFKDIQKSKLPTDPEVLGEGLGQIEFSPFEFWNWVFPFGITFS